MPRALHAGEVLEEQFADLLRDLVLDDEILDWVTEALRQSLVTRSDTTMGR
jgi:hypothetical protein